MRGDRKSHTQDLWLESKKILASFMAKCTHNATQHIPLFSQHSSSSKHNIFFLLYSLTMKKDYCCCCCCKTQPKLTVILAWIQTVVYSLASSIVFSSIFVIFLTKDAVGQSMMLFAYYSSKFVAVPVNLISEMLMAVSVIKNNKDISWPPEELRVTNLVVCFILLFFLLPAVIIGIILLKGVEKGFSSWAVRTWTVFAAVWFILSVMEIVAGGYVNGILNIIAYAIAIWIVHKEKREIRDLQNQIV